MIDTGADTSTNASDIAADAAPIVCNGTAVTAPTKAAVAVAAPKHVNALNTAAWQPITRNTAADVDAAAAANSAFGAPGPPGTASRPASAANPMASRPSVSPAECSRNRRYAITAASRARRATVTAMPTPPERRAPLASNPVRIITTALTPASQVAISAPTSRTARRVQRRSAAATDADTASAGSSKRGVINSAAELVRINSVPSRIPIWASVFDGSSATLPGRDS